MTVRIFDNYTRKCPISITFWFQWSERVDLNLRPPPPKEEDMLIQIVARQQKDENLLPKIVQVRYVPTLRHQEKD